MKQKLLGVCIGLSLLFIHSTGTAQISAEAQGGKLTLWLALGFDQQISEKWFWATDLGYGRHSDPDNYSVFKRQGLNVLTQDLTYKANRHWSFSFAGGYWRRNYYSDSEPFDARSAPYEFRNEFRPYQRIYYNHELKQIRIQHTLRTDYRFYYDQYLRSAWTTPFEFRARYVEKWKFPITQDQNNWVIISDEILTAIDRRTDHSWSPYQITENRLSFYYRRSMANKRIDLDLGVMHQYWRERPGSPNFNVSYNLMADLIIRNPFGEKHNKK